MSGGGGGRRAVHEEHEEHENHERWLVSYADMMTLLMVLFIVLFAISQVDSRKFAALKLGLSTGFGAPVEILSGGDQLLDPGGGVAPDDPNLAGANGAKSPEQAQNQITNVSPQQVADLAKKTQQAQVKGEVDNLKEARKQLQRALTKAGLKNGANFRFNEKGLVVTIATDNVLFDNGSATLAPRGERILVALGPTLKRCRTTSASTGTPTRSRSTPSSSPTTGCFPGPGPRMCWSTCTTGTGFPTAG